MLTNLQTIQLIAILPFIIIILLMYTNHITSHLWLTIVIILNIALWIARQVERRRNRQAS